MRLWCSWGQTPLKLARRLESAGLNIAGTSPESIDIAEDRERFAELCRELGVRQPPHGTALSRFQAEEVIDRIGFPYWSGPRTSSGDGRCRLQLRRAGRRPR